MRVKREQEREREQMMARGWLLQSSVARFLCAAALLYNNLLSSIRILYISGTPACLRFGGSELESFCPFYPQRAI